MRKLDEVATELYLWVMRTLEEFTDSEEGDTNFISMMIIIAIVVVLAGLFLTLGRGVMETVSKSVTDFLKSLGG